MRLVCTGRTLARWLASAFALTATSVGAQTVEPQAATLYHNYCSVCHGDKGDGRSRAAHALQPPPKDFTAPAARNELSRERIVAAIKYGRPGTAMVAWRTQLSDRDIDRLADYLLAQFVRRDGAGEARGRQLFEAAPVHAPANVDMTAVFPKGLKGDVKRGSTFYLANCATCHGSKGDGQGPRAYFINPKPLNFVEPTVRARLNRVALFAGVAEGRLGTEMPAWNKVLNDQQIADVAEYVFQRFIRGQVDAGTTAQR